MRIDVETTQSGDAAHALERLRHRLTVLTGFPGEEQHDDGPTIAQVAAWNEFGVRGPGGAWRIPPRPFMRLTAEQRGAEWTRRLTRRLGDVLRGTRDLVSVGSELGQIMRGHVQLQITTLSEPPNAASTLRQKAPRTNPLIDTGQMRQSVRYVVEVDGVERERG